jgi:decaprenyl-phosphate phosphoribosyltransferase
LIGKVTADVEKTAPTAFVRGRAVAAGLVRSARPRQWVKNVLVIAAPLAAGQVADRRVLLGTLVALVCFSLVASSIYLINDVRDVAEDRRHPTKRFRPIAAGIVPPRLAVVLAVVLLAAGLGLSLLATVYLTATLGVYAATSLAYSIWLKHEPVIDIAVVASGFLLRAIAGGVASGLPLSQWFLLVASFGSLFMVAGKRYSELSALGPGAETRRSLEGYSTSYLRFVWTLSASVTVAAYSLWAFEMASHSEGVAWEAISIAPFVLSLLRYAVDVDRGSAGEPEDIVLRDRGLQLLGLAWLLLFVLGVFDD